MPRTRGHRLLTAFGSTSALLLLACGLGPGCALAGGPPIWKIAPEINATLGLGKTVLGSGDKLKLFFTEAITFDHELEVRPDGFGTFKGLDKEIRVAGLTVEQLDSRLESEYSAVIPNTDLTVTVTNLSGRSVTVMGEVGQQGAVPIDPNGRLTLVEAIGRAGGWNKYTAHISSTLLVRWDPINQRQVAWKIDARPKHWDDSETIFLQAFDLVYIPNTPIDDVGIFVEMYIRRLIPFPNIVPLAQ